MENLESYSDLVNSSFQAIQSENFTVEQLQQQAEQKAQELQSLTEGITAPFEAEGLREGISAGINYLKSRAIDTVKQKGQDLLTKGKQIVSDKANELRSQVEAKANELKQRGLDNVEELKGQVQSKVDELTTRGEQFADDITNRVEAVKGEAQDFAEQARTQFDGFQNQASDAIDNIQSEVSDATDAIQNQATNAVQQVQSQVTQGVEEAQNQVSNAVQGIQSQADALQTQGTQLLNEGQSAIDNVVDSSDYTVEDAGATPQLDAMTQDQVSDFMDIVEGKPGSLGTSLTDEQFQQATQARQAAVRRGLVEADPEETAQVAEEPDGIFSTSASDAFMEARATGEAAPEPEMLEADPGLDPDVAQQVQILQSQRELADTGEIAQQFASPEIQAQATQFQDIDPINIGATAQTTAQDTAEAIDTEARVATDTEENIGKVAGDVGDAAEISGDVAEGATALDIDPATAIIGVAVAGIGMFVQNILQDNHTYIPPQVQFNVSQQLGI